MIITGIPIPLPGAEALHLVAPQPHHEARAPQAVKHDPTASVPGHNHASCRGANLSSTFGPELQCTTPHINVLAKVTSKDFFPFFQQSHLRTKEVKQSRHRRFQPT